MKTLSLLRDDTGDFGTFSRGSLVDGSGVNLGEWDWIELPWRDNMPEQSCIPPGTYQATQVQSAHFGMAVYLLSGIPDRSAVEIHPANFAADVTMGYYSDLRGCCAPGMSRGSLARPDNGEPQRGLLESRQAFSEFMAACDGDQLTVNISWKDGLP